MMRRYQKKRWGWLRDVAVVLIVTETVGTWVGLGCRVAQAQAQPRAAVPLVFRGVTVIDVETGQRRPNQSIIVVGTRIQQLGPAQTTRPPKGARIINARGKYLIPGLWDMHVHPQAYADLTYPLFIANGVTGVRDAGSEVPLATLSQWKREIAAGTRVGPRLIVAGPALNGNGSASLVPSDTTRIRSGITNDRHWLYVPLALARQAVDSLQAAGADMLKLYDMSPALRWAIVAEARRVGLPFGGHSADVPGQVFADSGATILDHQTWFQPDPCREVAPTFEEPACAALVQRLWQTNTWVMPFGFSTPVTWATIARALRYKPDSLEGYALLVEEMEQELAAMPRFKTVGGARAIQDSIAAARPPASTAEWLTLMQEDKGVYSRDEYRAFSLTGFLPPEDGSARMAQHRRTGRVLPIVAGTDVCYIRIGNCIYYTAGFGLPEVLLRLVVQWGLTPLEALQTATLNPARALRAADSLGTVATGKVADLVLLEADPLVDIWNVTKIRAVVANGRYYDRAMLDSLLAGAARAAGH